MFGTSRARVIKSLTFERPDKIPRDLWWLPAVDMQHSTELKTLLDDYPMDIATAPFKPGTSKRQEGQPSIVVPGSHPPVSQPLAGGRYVDEWGSMWYVGEDGVIGEVKKPVLDDLSKIKSFTPPWEYLDTTDLSEVNEAWANSDVFLLSNVCARPFERLQFVRGTEKLFIDLAYGTREIYLLSSMIHEYNLKHIQMWLQTDVDGIFMMDDWGAKDTLLISPDLWRELLKPLYKEYCDLIHRAGKYVFFHSDGCIDAVFADLIEIGIDVINSQLFTMNIEEIARQFKGKITFWGEISRFILHLGTVSDVVEVVGRVQKALYDEQGGLIAQCEWGKDNPPANIRAVYSAWFPDHKRDGTRDRV